MIAALLIPVESGIGAALVGLYWAIDTLDNTLDLLATIKRSHECPN